MPIEKALFQFFSPFWPHQLHVQPTQTRSKANTRCPAGQEAPQKGETSAASNLSNKSSPATSNNMTHREPVIR